MESYKTGAPEGETTPDQCPVCLEPWDADDRLPKFLICHHSICVTCAGEMQRTAKKRNKPSAEASTDGTQDRSASRASMDSLDMLEEGQPAIWVRCPMCRTRTFIEDPYMLQTNFYLNGMAHVAATPSRLILWCETCSVVATPECGDHILRPIGEKMRDLQDDLVRRADGVRECVTETLTAHESHMEVYRWLCGMLRHAHSKVLAALTHAAQYHQALQLHMDALQSMVHRGEQQQLADNPEEVIEQLTSLLKELDVQQTAINAEVELPIMKDTFQVLRTHQGPQGYSKALVVLDANKSVSLSLFGENDRQQQSCTSDDETDEQNEDVGITLMRALSLHASRRKKKSESQDKAVATLKEVNASLDPVKHLKQQQRSPQTSATLSQESVMPPRQNYVNTSVVEEKQSDPPEDTDTETQQEEQAAETPETTTPPVIPTDQTDNSTLQRNGNFGRGTVSMAYKRYPSHLYDEEPITDPSTVVSDKNDESSPVTETLAVIEERAIDAPIPEQDDNNDRNDDEEEEQPRNRNNRRKRRQRPPSEEGDGYPPQRSGRRQSTRRRQQRKKANKPMCIIA